MDSLVANNNIYDMHSMSIPSINPIVSSVIKASRKVLLLYLKLARILSNICCMLSKDVFGLINNSKYNSIFKQDNYLSVIPLKI